MNDLRHNKQNQQNFSNVPTTLHATSTQHIQMNWPDQNAGMSSNMPNSPNRASVHLGHSASQSFAQSSPNQKANNTFASRRSASLGSLPTLHGTQDSTSQNADGSTRELKSMLQSLSHLLNHIKLNGVAPLKAPSKLVKAYTNLLNYPHSPNTSSVSLFLAIYQYFFTNEKILKISLDYWDKCNNTENVSSTGALSNLFLSDQKQVFLDLIMKQIHAPDLKLRAFGLRFLLRFLSLLDRSDSIRYELIKKLKEHVLKNIKEFGLSSGDAKGKFKIINAVKNKIKEKTLDEKIDLVIACMEIIYTLPDDIDTTIRDFVSKIIKRKEPQLAKEALHALAQLTMNDSSYLLSLAPYLPEFEKIPKKDGNGVCLSLKKQKRDKKEDLYPHMNLEEVEARKQFLKLCTTVLPVVPKEWKHEGAYELKKYSNPNLQKWLSSLYCMLHETDHDLFLETLSITSRKNWAVLLEFDPISSSKYLAETVVERLIHLLHADPNLLFSVMKVIYPFVSGFVIFKSKFSRQIPPIVNSCMDNLWQVVSEFHSSPDATIRMRAFKASLWNTSHAQNIVNQLIMEIQGNRSWSPNKLYELACSLQFHSFIHHEIFDVLDEYCRYLCVEYSSRIDILQFVELCKRQLKDEKISIFGSRVLEMIFYILDNCLDGSNFGHNITISLVEFLGEYAVPICSPASEKEILTSNFKPNLVDMSIKDKFFRPEMFDIQNAAMKSIVGRLMRCATYNNTMIRITATKALSRIALLSTDPVRLNIYQCLMYLEQNPLFGVSHECRIIINILDNMYELQQQYYQLATALNPNPSTIQSFYVENNKLIERVKFFCSVPEGWLPLGMNKTFQFNA